MSGEEGNSHTNLEIGRTLERARAERGLSLWQVEEATKIRARYLHDLERENFDVLPTVYVLGSLKTYADFLGLDGEALVRELKNRQAPPPEERGPKPEEPTHSERGGFLAVLGGLPVIGGRDAVEEDEDAAPATVLGYGPRLYLGMGAVLILVLAVALGAAFGDGGQPAVSQVREPTISEAPSRIAFSGDAQDAKDDERNQDANGPDDQRGKQAKSPDDGDEKNKKEDEKDQAKEKDQDDRDDTRPEDTGDVAITLPAPLTASASTASASTASASASATATSAPTASASASASSAATASAASTPVANATASPSSAATVPASTTPAAAPAATAPETADSSPAPTPPAAEPAPTAVRPAPGGSGSGRRQAGGLDTNRLADEILGRVRSNTNFAR